MVNQFAIIEGGFDTWQTTPIGFNHMLNIYQGGNGIIPVGRIILVKDISQNRDDRYITDLSECLDHSLSEHLIIQETYQMSCSRRIADIS